MLENWFNPLSKDFQATVPNTFGESLQKNVGTLPNLKKTQTAIVGSDAKTADAVRAALYGFGKIDGVQCADLGNVKKTSSEFTAPVLRELLTAGIIPILIGKKTDTAFAQFLAYRENKQLVSVLSIDSKAPKDELFYQKLLFPKHELLFNFSAIGLQRHELSFSDTETWKAHGFDLKKMGNSRLRLEDCEPLIRDADFISLHLRALKASDAPAVEIPSPSGYTIEELCQLSRYAGLSDKLTAFGVFGLDIEKIGAEQTAHAAAQAIWYFMEGVAQRQNDFPVSTDAMVEYLVEFRQYDHPITFWKSNRSGRWWVQVAEKPSRKVKRHRLVPCTYGDYQLACNGELSDRLLEAMLRFG